MTGARMIRSGGLLLAAAAALGACSSEPEPVATVLVDYEHDEFATQFIRFFPDEVQAHPGDTISFEQYWTGEPHTVTFGTAVTEVLEVTRPLLAEHGHKPESEVPPEVMEAFIAAESSLPAQPCLIAEGDLPEDTAPPCEEQDLPPFRGTETYYNSGIIPYEGPSGNTFEVTLAEDIAPGTYGFYCAVHGSFQSGVLEVVAEDQPIRAPEENARDLREQVTAVIEPYEATFATALEGRYTFAGEDHDWNYAGLLRERDGFEGIINEFVPAVIEAEVDEPVTWRMFGPHSISFDVPEYFPIVEFAEDGEVRTNDAVYEPAGGAPPLPEEEAPPAGGAGGGERGGGEGAEERGASEGGEAGEGAPEPLVVDGGTWDGSGFWSSGVLYSEAYVEYTVRVSEPGTYRYACLIHPPMVGTLRVVE